MWLQDLRLPDGQNTAYFNIRVSDPGDYMDGLAGHDILAERDGDDGSGRAWR